ncbi:MAG: glycosyltransferase family 2 protein [Deltaproteobacteria bacterium]|nr:glycosyltransferase family 2 protein [Deltaproteobacteria bacterium]
MTNKPSISIIVPCLNEEGNLKGAIESIKEALKTADRFGDCEILIFNDGSTDNTGQVAEEISRAEKNVKVIDNPKNMGFGYNYTEGVRLASKDYTIMVPGDNEIPAQSLARIFSNVGAADIVIPYTANPEVRKFSRRVVSKAFVALINTLFGLNLVYYNGTCVIKSALLKKVPLKTWGFAYMAAILVRLIRSGASYTEVGVDIKPRATGTSKAFAPKNVLSVGRAILTLFWDVRIKDRDRVRAVNRDR